MAERRILEIGRSGQFVTRAGILGPGVFPLRSRKSRFCPVYHPIGKRNNQRDLVDGHETEDVGAYVPVGPRAQQDGNGRSGA